MAIVAAAVAGEPAVMAEGPVQPASGVGGGLFGMTDPDDVGASGELGDADKIGDEVLDSADDLDRLLDLADGDLPTGEQGLPGIMAEAYRNAANLMAVEQPNCNLHWSLLASIGRIESNHARGGQVDSAGNTVPNILGPVLNGGGFAAIRDTDSGRLDGDARWDRAVGAMQFIPSTWRGYAADGNNDGVSSPHNVWDATLAAGRYLCSGGMDLSDERDVATAVFRYNRSDSYVATVILWAAAYRSGTPILPSEPVASDPGAQAMGPPSVVGGPGPKPNPSKPGAKPPTSSKPPSTGSTAPTTTSPGTTTIPGSRPTSSTSTRPTQTTVPCTTTSTTTTTPSPTGGADQPSSTESAPAESTGAIGSAVSSTTSTTTSTTTTPTPPPC